MSLALLSVKPCAECGREMPVGRRGGGRVCDACKYERRRLLLRARRLNTKKCRRCRGAVRREGAHCTDYCRWIAMLKRRHQKIILVLGDIL
jgi:NMD protein affecting ribosome stability and mRNA decay